MASVESKTPIGGVLCPVLGVSGHTMLAQGVAAVTPELSNGRADEGSDPKDLGECEDDGVLDLSHLHESAQQFGHRSDTLVGDAAGDDQVELLKIGVHVER